jgi:hypothetical protein
MNCGFQAGFTLADIFACTMLNVGIPYEIAALFIIAGFALITLMARLDFDFSLAAALILSYGLLYLSGNGSYMLTILTAILTIAVGLRIFIAVIHILRQ